MLPAGIAAVGGLVMLLWNWLIPALFAGARHIDYWQALGLLLLSKLLLGRGGHGRWGARGRHWDSLSTEEREHLRRHFKSRWGRHWGSQFGADRAEADDRGDPE